MRWLIIFLLFPCFTSEGFSQVDKKDWLVGGGLTGTFSLPRSGSRISSVVLSPDIGYFLFNKFAVGIDGSLGRSSSSGIVLQTVEAGPFIRFYINATEEMKIMTYGSFRYSSYYWAGAGTSTYLSAHAGFGPAIFPNEHVAIELLFNYDVPNLNTQVFQGIGSISLGFQIHLIHEKDE